MTEREVSSERLPERCPHCDLQWIYNPPAIVAGTDKVRCIECKTVFVPSVSSERVSEERLGQIATDKDNFYRPEIKAMAQELLSLRSSVKMENDQHRFAVVSADYSRPFLVGAYPKLENALKAQCGSPEKWHIFERCAIEAPSEGEAVKIGYTNWRGEYAEREIVPMRPWFGSTEWHPEPQWLLEAWDVAKGAERDFAIKDIGFRPSPAASSEVTEDWIRDTAMNVMLATEVEEAVRVLTAALKGDRP